MRRLAGLAVVVALVAVGLSSVGADDKPARLLVREPVVSFDKDGAPTVTCIVGQNVGPVLVSCSWDHEGKPVAGSSTASVSSGGVVRARLAANGAAPPPSTKVRYEVVANGTSLGSYELKTLPPRDARHFAFAVLGDSGYAHKGQKDACPEQVAVAKALAESDPDLVIHTGDVVYNKGEPENLDPLFFVPYKKTLARVPYFTCLGNHDVMTDNGKPSLEAYPYPPNETGNRYYSFDAGNVHFVCLDSNEINKKIATSEEFLATPQGKWLKADLASARSAWKVAFFHHPLYSASKRRMKECGDMRAALEPLLLASVDLVITGHDHYYHRTAHVAHGKRDPDGLVHFQSGGGGAPLDPPEDWRPDYTVTTLSNFHFVRFVVEGKLMRYEALGASEGKPLLTLESGTVVARSVH